jgi:hypothetical protein
LTQVKPEQQGFAVLHAWPGSPHAGHLLPLVHVPAQHGCEALHDELGPTQLTHLLSAHAWPVGHAMPHALQLPLSLVRS